MRHVAWILGISMAIASVGCGSDDSGGGGSFDSGIAPDKQGEDVTQNEAEQFCNSLYDYQVAHAPSKASQCKAVGLLTAYVTLIGSPSDTELRKTCSDAVKDCMEEPDDPTDPDCDLATVPVDCTSTVAEIETCATDKVAQANSQLAALPACDGITREQLQDLAAEDNSDPPKSCETVQENCPEGYSHL